MQQDRKRLGRRICEAIVHLKGAEGRAAALRAAYTTTLADLINIANVLKTGRDIRILNWAGATRA